MISCHKDIMSLMPHFSGTYSSSCYSEVVKWGGGAEKLKYKSFLNLMGDQKVFFLGVIQEGLGPLRTTNCSELFQTSVGQFVLASCSFSCLRQVDLAVYCFFSKCWFLLPKIKDFSRCIFRVMYHINQHLMRK